MPRPTHPPTPGSSGGFVSLEATTLGELKSLALPPPAMKSEGQRGSRGAIGSGIPENDASPTSTGGTLRLTKRRRSSEELSLPPPPTRARRIIQMKPEKQDNKSADKDSSARQIAPKTNSTKQVNTQASTTSSTKKKPQGTSRKTARKTAHSIIERRRRGKMNEEFGVLKDMIPACSGHEMHKLAILQASIEYMTYLKQCVFDLQSKNRSSGRRENADEEADVDDPDRCDQDAEEMNKSKGYEFPTPSSPFGLPMQINQQASMGSLNTTSSPGSGSDISQTPTSSLSALTSPALQPVMDSKASGRSVDKDEATEATEALLMLNADRRSSVSNPAQEVPLTPGQKRAGMSVKELLDS